MWENIKSFTLRKVIIKLPRGFTLIELLVVIAIIAVIATATILVINPAELIKQGRDSTRLSDLNNINRSLGFLQVDNPTTSFGTSSIVYVSIPDTSSTCANLGLASLPAGWTYSCATDANHRKTDGNGWIPADFTSFSAGSPLSVLPIDPINTTSTGNYYTYVTGGSWELTTLFESVKHTEKAGNDGGPDPAQYETGTDLVLSPFAHGLVGWWKIDEGSGTETNDSSGFTNTGTMYSSSTITDLHVAGCRIEGCASFDGTDDYVVVNHSTTLAHQGSYTVVMWIYLNSHSTYNQITQKSAWPGGATQYQVAVGEDASKLYSYAGSGVGSPVYSNSSMLSDGSWIHIAVTHSYNGSNTTVTFHKNGQSWGSGSKSGQTGTTTNNLGIGASGSGGGFVNGRIDELRIYNRALSAAEIQAIYNATN